MAVVRVATASVVPGLHVTPTIDDLKNSAQCWNSLPESLDQLDAPARHLNELAELLKRHGAHKRFAIHLIHRHDAVGAGEVVLGTNLETLAGSWTRPMKMHDIDLANVHGHIFKLTSEGLLQAYEYRTGPLVDLSGIPSAFFSELIGYLRDNRLANLLGLEVIETEEPLAEFDLGDNGTVMLKQELASYGKIFKETGFFYCERGDGMRELKGNTVHAETTKPGVHKVFIDAKLRDEAALLRALQDQGIIEEE